MLKAVTFSLVVPVSGPNRYAIIFKTESNDKSLRLEAPDWFDLISEIDVEYLREDKESHIRFLGNILEDAEIGEYTSETQKMLSEIETVLLLKGEKMSQKIPNLADYSGLS